MDNAQTEPEPIPFDLSRNEEWTIHHVILDRIEAEWRSEGGNPPPITVYRVFDKVEAGTERFKPTELRSLREELASYRESGDVPERDARSVDELLERLDTALSTS